jgi:hypothetical protein
MDPKQVLHRYLSLQRDHLLAKLDGVGERDVRWPMTPTGTNLLGLVKHVASNELSYFGEVFDRPSNVLMPSAASVGNRAPPHGGGASGGVLSSV